MLGLVSRFLHWVVDKVSGEFLLRWPRRHANGGTLVLARSVWVSLLLYSAILALRQVLDPNMLWDFDSRALRLTLIQTLPWFGALFSAVYFALYTRFSSQWTYLAGVYNQIMAAAARPDHDPEVIAVWEAGFIEDSDELHLALKPMYAAIIRSLAEDPRVVDNFERYTPGGARRLQALLTDVDRICSEVDARWPDTLAGVQRRRLSP